MFGNIYDMLKQMYISVRDSEIWKYNLYSGRKWEEHAGFR